MSGKLDIKSGVLYFLSVNHYRRRPVKPQSSVPVLQLLVSTAVLVAAVFVCSWVLRSPDFSLSREARLAVALAPVPIALWVIAEYVRLIRRSDEFLRRVTLESLAIAYPLALVIGMAVEYLQKGGFIPGADVGQVWPIQALLLLPAYLYAHWRYR
jgi:hypothetical protein